MTQSAVAAAEDTLSRAFDLPETYNPAVLLIMLMESGHNARRKFDQEKLLELAASIREKGIVEPLVVRPFDTTVDGIPIAKFEIVAGARRYRAAKLAGRTTVPCVIREYSDEDVLELQIIENIQREELDPLEEAEGYRALIESNKARYSVGFIADRIGRNEKYVWDRLRLLNLTTEAKVLLEQDRITVGHATLISKLTPAQQKTLVHPDGGLWVAERERLSFEDDVDSADEYQDLKVVSIRELEAYIANHFRFNVKHASEVAPLEFGETEKLVAAATAKPGRGKKVIAITHEHHVQQDARDENERTFCIGSWKRADGQLDSQTCEHSVLGVIAVGVCQGQAFDVCIAKDKCEVHWKSEQKEKERARKLREKGQTKEAAEVEDRGQKAREAREKKQEEERKRWDSAQPDILTALAAAMKKARPGALAELVLLACDGSYNKAYLRTARNRLPAARRAEDILRQAALIVLVKQLNQYNAHESFPRLAKQFGVDVSAILKAHKKATAKEGK